MTADPPGQPSDDETVVARALSEVRRAREDAERWKDRAESAEVTIAQLLNDERNPTQAAMTADPRTPGQVCERAWEEAGGSDESAWFSHAAAAVLAHDGAARAARCEVVTSQQVLAARLDVMISAQKGEKPEPWIATIAATPLAAAVLAALDADPRVAVARDRLVDALAADDGQKVKAAARAYLAAEQSPGSAR